MAKTLLEEEQDKPTGEGISVGAPTDSFDWSAFYNNPKATFGNGVTPDSFKATVESARPDPNGGLNTLPPVPPPTSPDVADAATADEPKQAADQAQAITALPQNPAISVLPPVPPPTTDVGSSTPMQMPPVVPPTMNAVPQNPAISVTPPTSDVGSRTPTQTPSISVLPPVPAPEGMTKVNVPPAYSMSMTGADTPNAPSTPTPTPVTPNVLPPVPAPDTTRGGTASGVGSWQDAVTAGGHNPNDPSFQAALEHLGAATIGEKSFIGPNETGVPVEYEADGWHPLVNGVESPAALPSGNHGQFDQAPIDPNPVAPDAGAPDTAGTSPITNVVPQQPPISILPPVPAPTTDVGHGAPPPMPTGTGASPTGSLPGVLPPVPAPGTTPTGTTPTPTAPNSPTVRDLFTPGEAALKEKMGIEQKDLERQLREQMAARGINGSSIDVMGEGDILGRMQSEYDSGIQSLAGQQSQLQLQQSAQDLQRYGIDQSTAFQYAQMWSDAGFRQKALDLQSQGMSFDQALQTAAQTFQQGYADRSLNQQGQIANTQNMLDYYNLIYGMYSQMTPEQQAAAGTPQIAGLTPPGSTAPKDYGVQQNVPANANNGDSVTVAGHKFYFNNGQWQTH